MIRAAMKGIYASTLTVALSVPAMVLAQGSSSPASTEKPIRVVLTTAPSGGLDLITRPVMEKLSQRIGRAIYLDNRPGASGLIAANHFIARAEEEGSTIFSATDSFILNGALKRFPFDIRKVVVPVAQLSVQDYIAFAPPNMPVTTFKDLLDYARKNPGKVNLGSAGTGTTSHLALEIIKSKTGVDIVHVPYKATSQASFDLAANRIQLLISNIAGIQLAKAGKAKMIGVMTSRRMPEFPDVPTLIESGVPDFTLSNTYGVYMAVKTSPQTVNSLNAEIIRVLASPDIKEKYTAMGSDVAPPLTPAELRKVFFGEVERWEAAAKLANVKPEDLTD